MFEDPILVIDGNNLAYRCHAALLELTDQVGNLTGCIYGTLNALKTYIQTFSPSEIIICWDSGLSDWRLELFPDYKVIRKSRDFDTQEQQFNYEQYLSQLGWLQEILSKHPVKNLRLKNCEADDLVCYVTELYKPQIPKIIISSDHDFWQCITKSVVVWSPTRETYITKAFLDEHLGISPREYLIVRALTGDNTDEIPGFPGVGEKTAASIVKYVREHYGNSGEIHSYIHDQIFDDYYSKRKRTQTIEKEQLKRNFILMNLRFALIYLEEVYKGELCSLLYQTPCVLDTNHIQSKFLEKGLTKFLSNFLGYTNAWKRLERECSTTLV